MPQTSTHFTPETAQRSARYRALLMTGDWRAARRMALRDTAESQDATARSRAISDQALAEWAGGHYEMALDTLTAAAPLYDRARDLFVRGVYENARATVLEALERFDESLTWYAGARASFEEAGCELYAAGVANNAGFLQVRLGRAEDAIESLEWALAVIKRHGDDLMTAECHDSLSKAYAARAGGKGE